MSSSAGRAWPGSTSHAERDQRLPHRLPLRRWQPPTCGYGLGVGDINGDGHPDISIGVSGGNAGDYSGHSGSGAEGYVYVLYGKSSAWSSTYSLGTIY